MSVFAPNGYAPTCDHGLMREYVSSSRTMSGTAITGPRSNEPQFLAAVRAADCRPASARARTGSFRRSPWLRGSFLAL
jgi:hypothetical protein